jgi:hypothetical protein
MNPLERDMSADDDRRFDLLVDGELSDAESRTLLSGLDDEPGGWRRCALAFLEAQCWRRELAAVRDTRARRTVETPPPEAPISSIATPGRDPRLLRTGGTLVAMAATFVVAMVLGWWICTPNGADHPGPGHPLQLVEDGTPSGGAARGSVPGRYAEPGLAHQERGAVGPPADLPARWRWVTLTPAPGVSGKAEPIRVPAIESRNIDERWVRSLPGGVPPDVLKALRQAGHRVRHHRALAPFELEDGRRLLVPVDELDVHYVGNEGYQ